MTIGAPIGVQWVQRVGNGSPLRGWNRVASWIHRSPPTLEAAIAAGDLKQAAQRLGQLLEGKTDVATATAVLSQIGFEDPVATLVVSGGDPFILSAALYLRGEEKEALTPEFLGTLAWFYQRGRLEEAVRLILDFGVPWLHVRRTTENLYYEREMLRSWWHRRYVYRVLRGMKEANIPLHQWRDVFGRVDQDLFIGKHAPPLLRALRTAKRLGFQGSLLWEAAQLIHNLEEAKEDLAAIKRENAHSSQATIRRALVAYWVIKELGGATGKEGYPVIEVLEEAQIPIDQWKRFARDVRDYGMKALQLSRKYGCSVGFASRLKDQEEILERLSQTTIPSQEWVLVLREVSKRGVSLEEYLSGLERWEGAGYTWEEHYVFGVLLKQGLDFMQSYPPDVLRLGIELNGAGISWLDKFPSTEESIAASQAFDLAKKKFDGLLEARHWERLPDSFTGQEGAKAYLTITNRDRTHPHPEMEFKIKIFERGVSPIGKASIDMDATLFQNGDILYVANIQSDFFRGLPKDRQEQWKDWERIFIQFLENWARENGMKRLLLSTVFGATSAPGTLASAAMRNLVNVYLLPRELGYELTPVEEEWLSTIRRFTTIPRYFWGKSL